MTQESQDRVSLWEPGGWPVPQNAVQGNFWNEVSSGSFLWKPWLRAGSHEGELDSAILYVADISSFQSHLLSILSS